MTKDEALKMAIEAMNSAADYLAGDDKFDVYNLDKAFFACKEALEQPAQEPVLPNNRWSKENEMIESWKQPAQEPVAWRVLLDESPEDTDWHYMTGKPWECFKQSAEPLYTRPTPSWQGLSVDERYSIIKELSGYDFDADNYDVAVFVEQALKEKNT